MKQYIRNTSYNLVLLCPLPVLFIKVGGRPVEGSSPAQCRGDGRAVHEGQEGGSVQKEHTTLERSLSVDPSHQSSKVCVCWSVCTSVCV